MIRALFPLLAALAAVLAVVVLGITQRSVFGTAWEDYFYGFFLDRYPLFLFIVIYGLARILTAAVADPGRRRWLRVVAAPLGLAFFLFACFNPTLGGLLPRASFFPGGMAFVTGQPLSLAYVLGAGAGAAVFAVALGLATLIARLSIAVSRRAIGASLRSFAALWWAALVVAAPHALGPNAPPGWPNLPLSGAAALATAGLVLLAVLPHTLMTASRPKLASAAGT